MAGLEIRLLGTPEVELDGKPLEVDTRKALALLAYLVISGGPQSRDTLAALLWPDYDGDSARASLRRTLSVLRKALSERWVTATRDAVLFQPEDAWVDVEEFHRLLRASEAHGHGPREACRDCLDALSRAARLDRGRFMAGFSLRDSPEFDDWQFAQAEALRRELDGVLLKLIALCAASNRVDDALGYARRRLALDPLNEAAHTDLMRLYAQAGDRSSALRQYRECVRVLDEELGVAPLDETTSLYEAILAGQLTAKPPESGTLRTAGEVRAKEEPPGQIESDGREARPDQPPLVGRSAELEALLTAYRSSDDDGCLVVVEGEAGVGKTRVVQEAIERVRDEGGLAVICNCYEGEANLAFGPLVGALSSAMALPGVEERLATLSDADLAEAARLLPDLASHRRGLAAAPALDTPAAQVRFFEGVANTLVAALAAEAPGLLAVEDVHWADQASLDLVMYLARRLKGRRLCLVLTWRSEDVSEGHILRRLLAEREREGQARHLRLGRLDPDSVRELAVQIWPNAEDSTVERLYQETEGLPFFVVQYLQTPLQQTGEGGWPVPGSVADLIQSRIARLGQTEQQVLSTAAIIGRSFTYESVREASGRSEEEVLGALESLLQRGFLRMIESEEGQTSTYDFAHERLRAHVHDATNAARRRLLHRRVAEALSRDAASRRASAAQVARHYALAGENAQAADFHKLAGHYARSLNANVEALAHFQMALNHGHPAASELHEQIAELQTLSGAYRAALASYQKAAAVASPEHLPALEWKIGGLYLRMGLWELAEQHLLAAQDGFEEQGEAAEIARVLADRSLVAHRTERDQEAESLARQALSFAESTSDRTALAQTRNLLGVLANGRGELETAREHLRASLSLAAELDDPGARIAASNNLALILRAAGELQEAEELANEALRLCVQQGDRHREAALRNNLADLLRALGRGDESMEQLKQAVALFAEIGAGQGEAEPEIWKLFEW